jgi:hypothetical protein
MNTLLEINNTYTNINIYSDKSLSEVAAKLELIPGIVLVTQPNYNEIEAYIDTRVQRSQFEQVILEEAIYKLFQDNGISVEYIRY